MQSRNLKKKNFFFFKERNSHSLLVGMQNGTTTLGEVWQFLTKVNILTVSQFSHSIMSDSLQPQEPQHARLPCSSAAPRGYSNLCPSSQWCHPTISSSVVPFSCLQSFPASGFFPLSQFFTSSGQSIGDSASASVLPLNIQVWFPLGLTGWISLHPKGLSRVLTSLE